ncbi:class I SAM-dependent methyltransferase [Micromonospora sp. NBC_01813]|uniref:class I SAM-dependent methyltransferase n=1 Tax=Micromonospora sp. NBC_01813 TaxID=2975988 RepID=UPI002DDC1240|nr:class I SAM-dependent methyltransferase [Micromonospora sp. NBC_01813]WSA11402.1 class I SAM-dependent methyltransferase [Micromonospora sp. NBC_01813]
METIDSAGYSPAWLGLREPADAQARSTELVAELRRLLAAAGHIQVHDLGCGTGSMGRWLAPQLPGSQHWVMHDRDAGLLEYARARMAPAGADGGQVTVSTRPGDVTALSADDLAGADLITTSALLDLLTHDELDTLAQTCLAVGCPALLTLTVVGEVRFHPADPLDDELAAAFNDHQRRHSAGRPLLGPDAVEVATEAFTRRGATVLVRPSPWQLGPEHAELTTRWLDGWIETGYEQRPELAGRPGGYRQRRLTAATAGELRVTVEHRDLLVLPK